MSQVSANPEEGHAGGVASEEAAAQLSSLPTDFEELLTKAKSATDPEPTIGGWNIFGDDFVEHMHTVKEQADIIAGNIQSGAEDISNTDAQNADDYSSTDIPPNV